MHDFTTPMMKQYMALKKSYPDCLLFFRLGDFYELFMEDAHIGAQVLDIALTSRPKGKDGRIPMAGVPYHAVESYLAKLVKAGYKVAICEQLSEPNNKGIVDRDVVRIITPGTLIDEKALDRKQNNYLISIAFDSHNIAISAADLSTGNLQTSQLSYSNLKQTILDEITKLHPTECILSESDYNNPDFLKILKQEKNLNIYPFNNWNIYSNNASNYLKEHFCIKTLAGFGIEDKLLAVETSATLIGYLKETQKDKISHIKKVSYTTPNNFVSLDKSTILNLELFSTIKEHDLKGSLLSTIDQTQTAMGGRMLRNWLAKPLAKENEIQKRLEVVELFYKNYDKAQTLKDLLSQIPDIERTISKLSIGIGNARDLTTLKLTLVNILKIKKLLSSSSPPLLKTIYKSITESLNEIIKSIEQTIVDDPPVSIKEGGIIKAGIFKKLDNLKQQISSSKNWILSLETAERERTGITSLKVRYNKVFGFYIEISKANLDLVPTDYIRKQTLVGAERFITPQLKEKEEIVLTAEIAINDLEFQIFQDLVTTISKQFNQIQSATHSIATLDCLISFALNAHKRRYVKPKIIYSGEIKIKNGRHPVVEDLLEETPFVPNDCILNHTNQQLLVITGPNMAGKSVYIRQVALIVLMAQIGSFVPAEKAYITLVDKIFVRSGASDVITSGLSTFMVEMMETANILNNATNKSLIVMDEIGRGTSTYDGISIAWAVAEYLVTHPQINPKTLFATHYHELQDLEKHTKKIKNLHMSVSNTTDEPIFLHTIMPGPASHSFGVAVAKLAGIPSPVIDKAKNIQYELEQRQIDQDNKINIFQKDQNKNFLKTINQDIINEINSLEIHKLTPLEAINKLALIQDKIKNRNSV